MTFKLKPLFTQIGQLFQRELMANIDRQKDINGQRFSLIEPSTARGRASKMGAQSNMARIGNKAVDIRTGKVRKSVAKSVPVTRLLFTKRFWHGAFKFGAENESVAVFVNPDSYPIRAGESPITFKQIVRYNNQGEEKVNPKIKHPPLVFPNTEADVQKMDAYKKADELIKDSFQHGEILKQIEAMGLKNMTTELHISL